LMHPSVANTHADAITANLGFIRCDVNSPTDREIGLRQF
jgi:hypothetical protein